MTVEEMIKEKQIDGLVEELGEIFGMSDETRYRADLIETLVVLTESFGWRWVMSRAADGGYKFEVFAPPSDEEAKADPPPTSQEGPLK